MDWKIFFYKLIVNWRIKRAAVNRARKYECNHRPPKRNRYDDENNLSYTIKVFPKRVPKLKKMKKPPKKVAQKPSLPTIPEEQILGRFDIVWSEMIANDKIIEHTVN